MDPYLWVMSHSRSVILDYSPTVVLTVVQKVNSTGPVLLNKYLTMPGPMDSPVTVLPVPFRTGATGSDEDN